LQAQRIRSLYEAKRAAGEDLVAIVGDFNDTPGSDALRPLLHDTDLRDVFTHAAFDDGGHPGTFGSCTASNKIDYILLSPAAWARVTGGGVWRKGMWPGVRPVKWDVYPELTLPRQVASDHAAVWVDLDL
jgi:endonuclease/exonuclease/phosphatase family metal-dependent hydrolase